MIKNGTADIKTIYIGTNSVIKIYIGNILVY